jgi:hypothetical protein
MSDVRAHAAVLADRGIVAVTGPDAVAFLDNLATNALDALEEGDARFAALLTPQGKILFEFFAVRTEAGFLLDTHRDRAAEFAKRLALYKLRAKVEITDRSDRSAVAVVWWTPPGAQPSSFTYSARVLASFADTRNPRLGLRLLLEADGGTPPLSDLSGASMSHESHYAAHRVAIGVPEGGRDYALGDTFPHEANYDRLGGVSFTKGCFVGQEVVARMQNKSVVRKRVVSVTGDALAPGAAVLDGAATIGTVGSVDGGRGLALVRLDRADEAIASSRALCVAGRAVTIDADALARYRAAIAAKPLIDL